MKQTLKRLLLMVCMAACLFSLTACTSGENADTEAVDEYTEQQLCKSAEGLLHELTSVTEEEADIREKAYQKNDDDMMAGAVASWKSVMKDTGSLQSVNSSHAALSDDGYVCTLQVSFEKRDAEFKVFYEESKGVAYPTSMSISPEYTTKENMAKAGMNTLMGMGTVFAVLIFISLLIGCFKYINVFEGRMKAKKASSAPAAPVAPEAPAPVAAVEENLADDLELVAVITAAIAASANTSADGLVVRSIRRAPGAKWKRA